MGKDQFTELTNNVPGNLKFEMKNQQQSSNQLKLEFEKNQFINNFGENSNLQITNWKEFYSNFDMKEKFQEKDNPNFDNQNQKNVIENSKSKYKNEKNQFFNFELKKNSNQSGIKINVEDLWNIPQNKDKTNQDFENQIDKLFKSKQFQKNKKDDLSKYTKN